MEGGVRGERAEEDGQEEEQEEEEEDKLCLWKTDEPFFVFPWSRDMGHCEKFQTNLFHNLSFQ